MWTAFFILCYSAARLLSSILPPAHDWSGSFDLLGNSISWLKANNDLLPIGLMLTELGLMLTWASLEIMLILITTAVRLKSYAVRAFTFG